MVCNTVLRFRVQAWDTQLSAAPIMHESRQKAHVQAQAAMLHKLGPAWPLSLPDWPCDYLKALQRVSLIHIVNTNGHLAQQSHAK